MALAFEVDDVMSPAAFIFCKAFGKSVNTGIEWTIVCLVYFNQLLRSVVHIFLTFCVCSSGM